MEAGVAILGATGSVGTQSVEVCRALGLPVTALTARRSVEQLEAQARQLLPRLAVLTDEDAARTLRVRLADTPVRVAGGAEALLEAATLPEAGTVLTAVVGTVGLLPTLAAIRERKRLALANKETLVCAGHLVTEAVAAAGAELLPVDSEHSAIFQCLAAGRRQELSRILLTGSGGPFRGWERERVRAATRREALRHPNWSMGEKITVDSATLMNKGLEYIEAMHLFGVKPEEIRILIHPQSVIHSLVEFRDGSVVAQMGAPDMRLPIQYALTYPRRLPGPARRLELTQVGPMTFEEPDVENFPCLRLAVETAPRRDAACAVMNAANEAAVARFLREEFPLGKIYDLTSEAVARLGNLPAHSVEEILQADGAARRLVGELCGKARSCK